MATLTLRPDAAGDDTLWTPNTGANYAAVDEASNDGDTTYVARDGTEVDDLYNLATDAALTGATISNVRVYASSKYVESGSGVLSVSPTLKLGVKSGGTEYWDTGDTITGSYADYYQDWATNPADSAAWEKADIDALQVGIRSARTTGTGSKKRVPYVTQVWIVVTYTVGSTYTLVCEQGSFSLTGQDTSLLAARKLTAEQGSFALTGQAASLLAGRNLTCEQGSVALTGQDVGLSVGRILTAEQGSIALTGQDVTLTYHGAGPTYTLTCEQGSLALTGQAAGLLAGRLLTCEQGTANLTGQAASLLAGRNLTCEQGSVALTGQDTALLANRKMTIDQGSYALTGQDAGLLAARKLVMDYGGYSLTGQDAGLLAARLLTLAYGAYVLTGQDVDLTYVPPSAGVYTLACDVGSFVLTGQDVELTYIPDVVTTGRHASRYPVRVGRTTIIYRKRKRHEEDWY